jgi:hypothetical protein
MMPPLLALSLGKLVRGRAPVATKRIPGSLNYAASTAIREYWYGTRRGGEGNGRDPCTVQVADHEAQSLHTSPTLRLH